MIYYLTFHNKVLITNVHSLGAELELSSLDDEYTGTILSFQNMRALKDVSKDKRDMINL